MVGLDKSDEDINVVGYISKVLPGGYFDLKVDFQVKESNRLDIQIEYTPSNIPGVTALNQRIILFYLPVEYKLSQISARYPSQTSRSKKIE